MLNVNFKASLSLGILTHHALEKNNEEVEPKKKIPKDIVILVKKFFNNRIIN